MPEKAFARPGAEFDTSIGWRFANPILTARDKATFSMPETGEEVARVYGVTREEADAFALESHRRAIAAIDAGRFDSEIVGVDTARGTVLLDEGPRRDTTAGILAGLRPVVKGGTVVTAQRRRIGHRRGERGSRRSLRAGPASARHRGRERRRCTRSHGNRPRPRDPEGTRSGRPVG